MTPPEEALHDEVVAINFVADAGKLMLESSTSVSEVEDRLRDFLPSVGLDGCSMDANMSSFILSYWHPGRPLPLTTMREVMVAAPRLELLAGAGELLDQVQTGQLALDDAAERLTGLRELAPPSALTTRVAMLVSVVGWVVFAGGLDLATVAVALAATVVTFPVDGLVERLHLPTLAATVVTAIVVAGVPNLAAAAGLSLLVGPAVVGALFPILPGRAFVSSVVDGLAGAPVASLSRGIQALSVAGFLALGMLMGSSLGTGLGLTYEPNTATTPLVQSLAGAAVGVLGLAIAWSMPRRQLAPTVAISAGGWLLLALLTGLLGSAGDWPAYGIAAAAVGVAGSVASAWQRSSASVYTGVAILPLAPGLALYAGMLAYAQGNSGDAGSTLNDAGVISLAIAGGIASGLAVGRDAAALAAARRSRRTERRDRRPAGGLAESGATEHE